MKNLDRFNFCCFVFIERFKIMIKIKETIINLSHAFLCSSQLYSYTWLSYKKSLSSRTCIAQRKIWNDYNPLCEIEMRWQSWLLVSALLFILQATVFKWPHLLFIVSNWGLFQYPVYCLLIECSVQYIYNKGVTLIIINRD